MKKLRTIVIVIISIVFVSLAANVTWAARSSPDATVKWCEVKSPDEKYKYMFTYVRYELADNLLCVRRRRLFA